MRAQDLGCVPWPPAPRSVCRVRMHGIKGVSMYGVKGVSVYGVKGVSVYGIKSECAWYKAQTK